MASKTIWNDSRAAVASEIRQVYVIVVRRSCNLVRTQLILVNFETVKQTAMDAFGT